MSMTLLQSDTESIVWTRLMLVILSRENVKLTYNGVQFFQASFWAACNKTTNTYKHIHTYIVYSHSYVIFRQGRQHTRHNAKLFKVDSLQFKKCISLFAVLVNKPFFLSNSPQPSLPTPVIKDSCKFSNTVGVVLTWRDELALENLNSLPSTSIKSA